MIHTLRDPHTLCDGHWHLCLLLLALELCMLLCEVVEGLVCCAQDMAIGDLSACGLMITDSPTDASTGAADTMSNSLQSFLTAQGMWKVSCTMYPP
jgi:hypothetical protein